MNNTISTSDGNTPKCPTCGSEILGDDVNVVKDVAYCRSCNLVHKFSTLVQKLDLMDGIDLNRPPSGVHCTTRGEKLTVDATYRSLGAAIGALAFSLFWNGIVSVFVLLVVSSSLHLLDVPVPNWFPAPEMNNSTMGLGMTLFLWLFLTPFILIGISMIGVFFMSLGGRVEVRIDSSEGTVFTGIGPLGYRRRFLTSQVSDVRIDDQQWRDRDKDRQRKTCVVIEMRDGKLIKFGSGLSEDRRKFVGALLNQALVRDPDHRM